MPSISATDPEKTTGISQTTSPQRSWLSVASIPDVYVMERSPFTASDVSVKGAGRCIIVARGVRKSRSSRSFETISDSDYLPGIGRLVIKIPVGDDLLLVIGELFSGQRGHPSKLQ